MGNVISKKPKLAAINRTLSENHDAGDCRLSTYSGPKTSELRYSIAESQITRLHNLHYLLKHTFQTSYFAPVGELLKQPRSYVLDMGWCHCSTWTIEMAYDFPEAVFIGTDTIEPLPEIDLANAPGNIRHEKSFILEQLNQPDNSFIYVHQRFMYNFYCQDDIPLFMKELKRTVKPGGYLELVEADLIPKRVGPLFKRIVDISFGHLKGSHASVYHGPLLHQVLLDYGFQEVKSDYGSIPLCWGGYIGKLMYECVLSVFQNIGPTIYSDLMDGEEYSETKYAEYIDQAFDECVQNQTFFNIHWAYGRKGSTTTCST